MRVDASDLSPTIETPHGVVPGASLPRVRSVMRWLPLPLGQSLLIAIALFVMFDGWQRDFRVPLGFVSDSLWYLAQAKSTVDNGWWWWNPRIGAPHGLDEVSFPSNSTVDQALVWLASRFVPDAFAAINLTWMALVVLSGLTATWCSRALGASTAGAFAVGTLFALSPYALYRNIDHFALVIYLVPFACAAALWLAAGEPHQTWGRTKRLIIWGGCVLLGLNYVYNAFFASFCILVGAVIGYFINRDRRVLASGALCLALIAGSTVVNLSPTFYSWYKNGQPLIVREKVPAEAEVYGLKIRHLLSPVFPHRFAPFNQWVEQEAAARFPNENENWTARLGVVAAAGFLGLLVVLLVPDARSRGVPLLQGASRLTMAALLLGTVGGFGVVFNLAVSSDIRAYNRISVFITFFSLLAVVVAIDRLFKSARARTAAIAAVVLVGLVDQGQAARRINERHAGIAAEVADLRSLVGALEGALPSGAMVFQLPVRAYMSESDFGRMKQYDQFKPYLVSKDLRFSYPAFSNEQVRWQQEMTRLDVPTLGSRLAAQRFAAVLVDRYGYEDQGAAVIANLRRTVGDDRVILSTDRFMAVDIRALAESRATATPSQAPALTLSLAACAPTASLAPMVSVADQVDQIGESRSPWSAAGARIRRSQESKVSGWAVDGPRRVPAAGVDVVIDRAVFPTTYGTHRNDVAQYFKRPSYRDTGFTAIIPANALARGEHWLSIRVVTADGGCYFESPGFRTTVE
jgi:phosphoglycerol transferase